MFLLFKITPELFSSMGGALESQKCLFKTLLDMLLESKSSDLTSLIKNCLQRVRVQCLWACMYYTHVFVKSV